MKGCLRILILLGILAGTGLGWKLAVNDWRNRQLQANREAIQDVSTVEGFEVTLSDPRLTVTNHAPAVLIAGAVALVLFLAISSGISRSRRR